MATQYPGGSNPSRDPNNRELNRPARGGMPWIWLIVAIVVAFIVWFFVASGNRHGVPAADVRNGNPTTTADNTANTPNPNATTAAAITSPADIVKASDQQSLVGKTVRLQDVKVQKVGSNGSFWVTDDNQNKLLVVRDNNAMPAGTDSTNANSGMASNPNSNTQSGTNPMNSSDTAKDNTAANGTKANSTGIGTMSPSNSSQQDANATTATSPTEPVIMGQTVTVAGVVQQLPTDKAAQKQMGLKSSDTRGQQVYIAANQVNVQH
jgi:hypothetical protein